MPPGDPPSRTAMRRIRDRATFRALRSVGRRGRAGPLTVVYLPEPDRPPAVAFAIGRRVGPAVVRNRLRRRLRAALQAVDMPPGAYLVTAAPEATAMPFEHLRAALQQATAAAISTRTRPPA